VSRSAWVSAWDETSQALRLLAWILLAAVGGLSGGMLAALLFVAALQGCR
jgi:hypothetical protein